MRRLAAGGPRFETVTSERADGDRGLGTSDGTHVLDPARYQSAAASAREVLACYETADALGFLGALAPERVALFDRVIGTLVRLSRW